MEMIVEAMSELSADPRAWAVAALVALKAAHSLYLYLRCPLVRGAVPSPELVEAAQAYRFRPTPRFLITMLLGVSLAIGGLYMLHSPHWGALALGCLVLGVFLFMTEPSRLLVAGAMMAVFATADQADEASALARDQLSAAHRARAATELTIVAAMLALLWFF